MSLKNSAVFFVDAYTPNEGEQGLYLEYGVLRWIESKGVRPEVYVHSYLNPTGSSSRIRWAAASTEMKISREFLDSKGELPSLEQMISADYLKGKDVVCFDVKADSFPQLTKNCSKVTSILDLWTHIYSDDEKALSCFTISQMCDYIGLLPDDKANTNYTPLLKRLYQLAALWSFLQEIVKNPKRKKALSLGGMQFNFIWPLPKTEENWFETEPRAFEDLSDLEKTEFFKGPMSDKINWYDMSMYADDWIFDKQRDKNFQELAGQKELATFIFEQVLSFKMKMWVLIFYAQYHNKKDNALSIAKVNGDLSTLPSAVYESFTNFIIDNLEDFLSDAQKYNLIASLINQSLEENSKCSFEHYDYETLSKNSKNNVDGPRYYFTPNSPDNNLANCYKEIRDSSGLIVYIRYEVKGRGKERDAFINLIRRNLTALYNKASDPLGDVWLTSELKLWIQYITGIKFTEITRTQKVNDSQQLTNARITLKKIVERENEVYRKQLFDKFNEFTQKMYENVQEPESIGFNFQGISIEMIVYPPSKMGFLRKLFSLD